MRADVITLAHGAGGKASRRLIEDVFLPAFTNPVLAALGDSAVASLNGVRLAFTTDSYVVTPRVFPGGDIGELAVYGTVNDLAVAGAQPLWLSAGFVIEEGLPLEELRGVTASLARAAAAADVVVVAGDTKVVERGKADGLFLTTAGVGLVRAELGADRIRPGDRVLLSGTIGDHGIAILLARGGLRLQADVRSDTAPLHELAGSLYALGPALRWMRDPTRGGVATALNEIAEGRGIVLEERALPVREEVAGACEILGLDPLYVANEGKLIAVVAPDAAAAALASLRAHPLGRDAAIVGEIRDEPDGLVVMETAFGGRRIVDMLVGDPLPRIC